MIKCANCNVQKRPQIDTSLNLTELGKARVCMYGINFKWFCSKKCHKKYWGDTKTITAKKFAICNLDKLGDIKK